MGRMAVSALHLAVRHRVMGKLHYGHFFPLVTIGTDLKLALSRLHRINGTVNGMAGGTAHLSRTVLTERPMAHRLTGVAGKALFLTVTLAAGKADIRGLARVGEMGLAGAVAICAANPRLPALGVGPQSVGPVTDAPLGDSAVATEAAGIWPLSEGRFTQQQVKPEKRNQIPEGFHGADSVRTPIWNSSSIAQAVELWSRP